MCKCNLQRNIKAGDYIENIAVILGFLRQDINECKKHKKPIDDIIIEVLMELEKELFHIQDNHKLDKH